MHFTFVGRNWRDSLYILEKGDLILLTIYRHQTVDITYSDHPEGRNDRTERFSKRKEPTAIDEGGDENHEWRIKELIHDFLNDKGCKDFWIGFDDSTIALKVLRVYLSEENKMSLAVYLTEKWGKTCGNIHTIQGEDKMITQKHHYSVSLTQ